MKRRIRNNQIMRNYRWRIAVPVLAVVLVVALFCLWGMLQKSELYDWKEQEMEACGAAEDLDDTADKLRERPKEAALQESTEQDGYSDNALPDKAFGSLSGAENGKNNADTDKTFWQELSAGTMKLRAESGEVLFSYGVQGMARYGKDCLVTGSVTAYGKNGFAGSIEFELTDTEGQIQVYAADIDSKTCNFSLLLPTHRYIHAVCARLRDSEGRLLTERKVPLDFLILGTGQAVGVIGAAEPSVYRYLSAFGNYVVYLSPQEIPADAAGLGFFDYLVLDGCREGMLPETAAAAIKEWIFAGGTLIVGTGAKGAQTIAALREAGLFSGEIGEIAERQTYYGLTEETGQQIDRAILEYEANRAYLEENMATEQYTGQSSGQQPDQTAGQTAGRQSEQSPGQQSGQIRNLSSGMLYPGNSMENFYRGTGNTVLYSAETAKIFRFVPKHGTAAVKEEGDTLLYKEPFGKGVIEWYTISLQRKNFDYYGVLLAYQMRQNQSAYGKKLLLDSAFAGTGANFYIFSGQQQEKQPELLVYAILLVLYVLMLCGSLFVLIHLKKRRIPFGILVMVLSFGFFVLLYTAGGKTCMTEPYVRYIEIIQQESDGTAKAELTFLAAAPDGHAWKLTLPGSRNLWLMSRNAYSFYDLIYDTGEVKIHGENGYVLKTRRETGQTTLEIFGVPAFAEIEAGMEYTFPQEDTIQADVFLEKDGLAGELTNMSQTEYTKAYVYSGGILAKTEKLAAGETVLLEEMEQKRMLTQAEAGALFNRTEEGAPEEQMAEEYIYQNVIGNVENTYVLAATKQPSEGNPVCENAEFSVDGGVTLYVLHVEEGGDGYHLLTDKTMRVIEGSYSVGDSYRFMNSDEVIAEYFLEDAAQIEILAFLTVYNRNYASYGSYGFYGTVSLYNQKTGEWELLSSEFEDSELAAVPEYFSETGMLRVAYRKNRVYRDEYMQLPLLAYKLKQ